jgi:hypothetical protein
MPIQDEESFINIRSKEGYHLLEMKHGKKFVTQMMQEEMQECDIIITFLSTTSLTKNVPMNLFFPTC